MTEHLFNNEYLDLEDWFKVLSLSSFDKVKVEIQRRIDKLQYDIEKLGRNPSLDNSVIISTKVATSNELKSLLEFFRLKFEEKIKFDNKIKLEHIKQS